MIYCDFVYNRYGIPERVTHWGWFIIADPTSIYFNKNLLIMGTGHSHNRAKKSLDMVHSSSDVGMFSKPFCD